MTTLNELVELPLAGYYSAVASAVDGPSYLKLYPDSYWVYLAGYDFQFDFPTYLASLDVESLKQRFPLGCCLRGEERFRSWCGRYQRLADYPVFEREYTGLLGRLARKLSPGVLQRIARRLLCGRERYRINDALVLSSWAPSEGEFVYTEMIIEGVGKLEHSVMMTWLEFVPDGQPCPRLP